MWRLSRTCSPPNPAGEPAMPLLARVRASAPNIEWEAALPARVAPAHEAKSALERIARRISIELEDASETLVLLNDESRSVNAELVACVLSTALASSKRVRVIFARGSHPLPTPDEHIDRTF